MQVITNQSEQRDADGRVVVMSDGTPVKRAGASPFWMTDGIAPGDEHGCEELAQSWFGGEKPCPEWEHEACNNGLYLLRDGDFMEVNSGMAIRVKRADFPQWLADTGCPWVLTDAQLARIGELHEEVQSQK